MVSRAVTREQPQIALCVSAGQREGYDDKGCGEGWGTLSEGFQKEVGVEPYLKGMTWLFRD